MRKRYTIECKRCKKIVHLPLRGQKYCGQNAISGCSREADLERKRKHAKSFHEKNKNTKYRHDVCNICFEKFIETTPWTRFCKKCTLEKRREYEQGRKKLWRIRFKVLDRDNFTCRYCGRKSPEVMLEIDHIQPKAKGGNNFINNLTTSCRECNRGKGDYILKNII
jgi:5-methylcytosine-specific restriction endonuclease McrA